MKDDVIISICGLQYPEDGDDDEVELITAGSYYCKDGSYYITYEESEITGMNGTTTTLKVDKDCVTLSRSGPVSTQLIFERGQKHMSYYETMFGSLLVGVNAHTVKTCLDDDGGDIEVDYSVEIDHALAGESIFRVNVRKALS